MDLSTTYLGMRLPHPLIVGAGPLGDDLDTRQGARRRRRRAAGAALAVRGGNHRRADGRASSTPRATAIRSPRRAASRPSPIVALGPDEYLEHLRLVKSAVGIPVMASLNGVTPGGWTSYAQAARAGRRGRPRAAHLSRRQRHDVERGRGRTSGHRDRARGEAQPAHSGRRQARAAPHRLRALRQAARRGRRRRARALHALPPRRHRRRRARGDSHAAAVGFLGAAAAPPRHRRAGRTRQGVARDHRRRPHRRSTSSRRRWPARTPRRWSRRCFVTAPAICARSARRSSRGCRSTNGARSSEMRGNMSFERIPDPAAYERANFRMALR